MCISSTTFLELYDFDMPCAESIAVSVLEVI
jgi:hypothetical protein